MTYSVLIVEDDSMVLSINKRYVEKIPGFTVTGTATSMKEALKLITNQSFDLLLIDINLSNESGIDLVKALRRRENPADFIMITAQNEQETIQLCAQYGAVDYILKPFQFDRFKKSLLRFKYQKELLANQKTVNQEEIDDLYWTKDSKVDSDFFGLEKGLTEKTLQLILSVIDSFNRSFTIEELTIKTSLSHVSVRKYVRYLEEEGILEAQQKYGTIGRPTMHYVKVK